MFTFMPPMHKCAFLLDTYLFFAYLCKVSERDCNSVFHSPEPLQTTNRHAKKITILVARHVVGGNSSLDFYTAHKLCNLRRVVN